MNIRLSNGYTVSLVDLVMVLENNLMIDVDKINAILPHSDAQLHDMGDKVSHLIYQLSRALPPHTQLASWHSPTVTNSHPWYTAEEVRRILSGHQNDCITDLHELFDGDHATVIHLLISLCHSLIASGNLARGNLDVDSQVAPLLSMLKDGLITVSEFCFKLADSHNDIQLQQVVCDVDATKQSHYSYKFTLDTQFVDNAGMPMTRQFTR